MEVSRQQKSRFNWQVNHQRIEHTSHERRRPQAALTLWPVGYYSHEGPVAEVHKPHVHALFVFEIPPFSVSFCLCWPSVNQGEFASVKTNVIYSCKQHNDYLILQMTLTLDTVWHWRPCPLECETHRGTAAWFLRRRAVYLRMILIMQGIYSLVTSISLSSTFLSALLPPSLLVQDFFILAGRNHTGNSF